MPFGINDGGDLLIITTRSGRSAAAAALVWIAVWLCALTSHWSRGKSAKAHASFHDQTPNSQITPHRGGAPLAQLGYIGLLDCSNKQTTSLIYSITAQQTPLLPSPPSPLTTHRNAAAARQMINIMSIGRRVQLPSFRKCRSNRLCVCISIPFDTIVSCANLASSLFNSIYTSERTSAAAAAASVSLAQIDWCSD